ncbi:MAG: GAF domain-containing protein [Chloroflexi bacterium]|nr:GAF domain-containing protein [Chloroflexota bacterium]
MIIILGISITLQLFAAIYALTLIKITGKVRSWLSISIAIILMTFRRGITLYEVLGGHPITDLDWVIEIIALLTSLLLVIGIIWIAPVFRSMQVTNLNLKRSNRLLEALGECNQIIIYATDETTLMREICRVIVETGGYRVAWVGMALSNAEKTVQPVVQYGFSNGYLERIKITWDESETGQGPTGNAIRTGEVNITHEINTDPSFTPWREEALERNFRTSISFPIKVNNRVIGALNILSEQDVFDKEEVDFILELTNNMAFSIQAIRVRQQKEQTDRELFESQQRLNEVIQRSPFAVIEWNKAYEIEAWNPAAEKMFGYNEKEALGKDIGFLIEDAVRGSIKTILDQVYLDKGGYFSTNENICKDGKKIICEWHNFPLFSKEGEIFSVASLVEDVTERIQAEQVREYQLKRLSALRTIDTSILGSLNLSMTLKTIIEECIENLNLDAATIYQYDPLLNSLEYKNSMGFQENGWQHLDDKPGEVLSGQVVLKRKMLQIPDLSKVEKDNYQFSLIKAERFISYIGIPLIAKGRINGVLEVYQRSPLTEHNGWLDFLNTLAGQAAIAIDNAEQFEELQQLNRDLSQAYEKTLEGWSRTLELRDHETEGHSVRVANIALQLAKKVGVMQEKLVHIYRGALLHDIGKIGIPDSILHKAGPLTDEEWKLMKHHPQIAYNLLSPIQYLGPALNIPYCHHEKWDGSGYPNGLKGDHIPIEARIFAIIDVWDALRSDRPYRKAWDEEKTKSYIKEQSGSHFDPHIVQSFFELLDEMPDSMKEV